jgi:hypothetical protein
MTRIACFDMEVWRMKIRRVFWYTRFRNAAYSAIVVSAVWTVTIVLPFAPFSYLPPIIVGGGPGAWLIVAYLLYMAVGAGGFSALSALIFALETHERRILNERIMIFGLVLLFFGVTVGCILLGVAGAVGGSALTIQHMTVETVQHTLDLYVAPITLAAVMALVGAGLSLFGMVTAKATST